MAERRSSLIRPLVCPTIIGRDDAIAAIEGVLRRVEAGEGGTLLVSGEAGIGKSRILARTAELAEQRGWRLLFAPCFEENGSLPYAAVAGLLRAVLDADVASAQSHLGSVGGLVARLVPDAPLAAANIQSASPEEERQALLGVLPRLVHDLAAAQPCLIVVEDLHWCDEASLEAFLAIVRQIGETRALVVASYRSDEVEPALRHFLAALERQRLSVELPLERLSLSQVDAMLRDTLSRPRSVRADFLHALFKLTEGNPFFVEEVLRSVLGGQDPAAGLEQAQVADFAIPRSVQEAVTRRLVHLSPAAKELLQVAAVAGSRFDFDLLKAMSGLEEPELLPLIRELIGEQLVVEESEDRFAFRHALTREAIRTSLLAREQRAIHRRIGETLEGFRGQGGDSGLEDLAYHFYEAGDWQKALDYSQRAGDRALTMYAPGAALDHFNRAVEAATNQGEKPAAALLLGRASAYDMTGDFDRALADYEAAISAAETADDQPTLVQALLETGLLWASRDYGLARAYYERAVDLTRKAGDRRLLAHALCRLGNSYSNSGSHVQAGRHLDEALAIFRQLNDERGMAETIDLLGMNSLMGARLEEAFGYMNEAVRLFEALGDKRGLISPLATMPSLSGNYQSAMLVPALSLAEATEHVERAIAIAREVGVPSQLSFALFALAFCLGQRGIYSRALAAVNEGLQIARQSDHLQWTAACLCVRGALHADLLRPDLAVSDLEEALRLGRELNSDFWIAQSIILLTEVYIQKGDLERPSQLLRDSESAGDDPEMTVARLWHLTAETELALAQADYARTLAIIERVRNFAPIGDRLERTLGFVAWRSGRLEEAVQRLKAVAGASRERGNRSLAWRAYADLATLSLDLGDREAARQASDSAIAVLDEIGSNISDPVLSESFLAQAMNHLPAALRRRQSNRGQIDGLTAREVEIAVMVARGLSNRAMADELVLSARTVESHVANAMAKLGFTSRAQLAAWAVEHNLLSEA